MWAIFTAHVNCAGIFTSQLVRGFSQTWQWGLSFLPYYSPSAYSASVPWPLEMINWKLEAWFLLNVYHMVERIASWIVIYWVGDSMPLKSGSMCICESYYAFSSVDISIYGESNVTLPMRSSHIGKNELGHSQREHTLWHTQLSDSWYPNSVKVFIF